MNSLEEIKYRALTFGQHAGLEDTVYLLSIIEQAEKALEKSIEQMENDHTELAMEFGYAGKTNDSEALRDSKEALKAIRGSSK